MPCWEVRTVSIQWKPENMDLVVEALRSLGYQVSRRTTSSPSFPGFVLAKSLQGEVTFDGTNLTVNSGQEHLVNPIKRAYAEAALKQTAKRFGWQLRHTKERQFQLGRR